MARSLWEKSTKTSSTMSHKEKWWAVVLNLFWISYPFIKQDNQICTQYTRSCSFIRKTKWTNSYSL